MPPTEAPADESIRADERRRIADLINENAQTFADAGADKIAAVRLVALSLRFVR